MMSTSDKETPLLDVSLGDSSLDEEFLAMLGAPAPSPPEQAVAVAPVKIKVQVKADAESAADASKMETAAAKNEIDLGASERPTKDSPFDGRCYSKDSILGAIKLYSAAAADEKPRDQASIKEDFIGISLESTVKEEDEESDGDDSSKENKAASSKGAEASSTKLAEPPFEGRCYSRDSIAGAIAMYSSDADKKNESSAEDNQRSSISNTINSSSHRRRSTAMSSASMGRSRRSSINDGRRGSRPGLERRRSSTTLMMQSSIRNLGKQASKADLRFDMTCYSSDSVLGALTEKKPIVRSSCCAGGKCSAMQNLFLPPGVAPLDTSVKKRGSAPMMQLSHLSSCCDEEGNCTKKAAAPKRATALGLMIDTPAAETAKHTHEHAARLTCLAVVRPDNSAVDVFDAMGHSMTFLIDEENIDIENKDLCFSTHGAAEDVIGMVSPKFDPNGEHVESDERCPCGEDKAHLHAHVHDPDVCGDKSDGSSGERSEGADWKLLSQLTLHLEDGSGNAKARGMSFMPISDSLPKECNSSNLLSSLSERGLELENWLDFRNSSRDVTCNSRHEYCDDSCKSHRMYAVKHGDHTDYLIHNEATGDLHMEHPNCESCGENDIHGRFKLVHTRSWKGGAKKGEGKEEQAKGRRINLHFFEAHKEPFKLRDVLTGLFELETSRVQAARDLVDDPGSRVGRSKFHVEGMCCASEIPLVEGILRPIGGVVEISINTTTKTVYVDHNVDNVSAKAIAIALTDQGFHTTVIKDAGKVMDQQMVGIPMDVFVKSTFDLASVSKEGRNNAELKDFLLQEFSRGQLRDVVVIENGKVVEITHNPYYLTAPGISETLASHSYNVKIISDGGADGMWALSSMKADAEDTIQHHTSTVRWTVVLSGVFWVISMFSLIGGNWEYLKYVALLSVAFGLPPIAIKAFKTLRRMRFDVNCMMLFAVLGALPLQEYTEAAAVTFLFAISEALETRATARVAMLCLQSSASAQSMPTSSTP